MSEQHTSDQERRNQERRRLLKLLGSATVLVPLSTLTACGGGETPPQAAEAPAEPAPEPSPTPEPAAEAAPEPAAAEQPAELPALGEDDPQAVSLGYVQDASSVDGSRYPQFHAGQACANCALYLGGDAAAGACSIFPGKSVMAAGWCSVYAPKG